MYRTGAFCVGAEGGRQPRLHPGGGEPVRPAPRAPSVEWLSNTVRLQVDTRTHANIYYLTGLLMLVAPYLFDFATGGIEQWLPQLIGAMIIIMSLLTRYELSLAKVIPLNVHLGVDGVAGVLLAASPWLFGFADLIWWPHLLVGLMKIVVALMTKRTPRAAPAAPRP